MLELILIRHGQTKNNVKGTYLGWIDDELNEQGILQAKNTSKLLKDENINKIYCSPLKRAINTAQYINIYHKKEIKPLNGLKERNFGIWDNCTYSDIKNKYCKLHDEWVKDWINFKIPKGESAKEFFERTCETIDKITCTNKEGKILIVTHGGCIKNIIAYLLNMGIEGIWRFTADNGGITKIKISEGYAFLTLLNGNNLK